MRNNEEASKQMKEIETRKESLQEFKMKCLTGSDVIALFISLFHSQSHHGCLRGCIVWFFDGLHQEENELMVLFLSVEQRIASLLVLKR